MCSSSMCPAYRYVASSSKAVLCSRRDRTACRHKMASRTRRLIMVVRRSGVYRSGGWKARRAFRSCLRSFRSGAVTASGSASGGSTVGRIWVTASANSALDRIGVMVVTGGGPFVPPFWTAAEDALIPADGWSAAVPLAPSAVPLEPFSEGMMTVSASVSMSGRDVGAGPKTDRVPLARLLVGGSTANGSRRAGCVGLGSADASRRADFGFGCCLQPEDCIPLQACCPQPQDC